MTEKVIRNGQVAVLVSPEYGAGWSTWADDSEAAMFAPDVVEWVEAGKPGLDAVHRYNADESELDKKFGHYGYTGGLSDVEIVWVPVGTKFKIEEYDGFEHIEYKENDYWSQA